MAPNDVLPPVEPPSAGFIVQLFVIPAAIVAIIIAVWATFNWLAHMGSDPRNYVEAMKRNNEGRWQEAVNLANELNRAGNEELRKDPKLLKDLADLFDTEIDAGGMDDKPVSFRVYLARAVGEFHLPESLPPLIKAAKTNRDDRERDVRLAALQAIARLVPHIPQAKPQADPALNDVLAQAAKDQDSVVRYHAAYTLGVLGGVDALRQLEVLLGDANVDVRMNAAVGLARHGVAACVPELAKILDPSETAGMLAEQNEKAREGKQFTMIANGLAAALQFHVKNPTADVKPLIAGIDKLLATNPQTNLKLEAEDVRRKLLATAAAAAPAP
ncbi:MAG: HEAT repeat domain-containing protein [Planctomycetia bacterium]|nr:HEAT repeat domain-containing protein [Planctomycetia bacterium]